MMKRWIWLWVILLALPIAAQEDDAAQAIFTPLTVSNVRLQLSEEDGLALIFDGSPTICEPLLVDVHVENAYIDINAFIPRDATSCDAPLEGRIALPELATDQAYVLFLNDYASRFYLAAPEAEFSTEAFAVIWGETSQLVAFNVISSPITSYEIASDEDTVTLDIQGEHPDGCITETFTQVSRDDVQDNLMHVTVLRLLIEGVMCPAEIVPFEETLSLGVPDETIIRVGEAYTRQEDGNWITIEPIPITVETVDVLATANGGIVAVEARTACATEIMEHIQERDYATLIVLAGYQMADAPCDADATATSFSFNVGALPVVINGTGYDVDGAIEPIAGAQSDNETTEGNFMRVDTVIESVEVTILESFPMQLQLVVSGFQPDGCDFPVEVEQAVDGNDVTLHIFRNVPADAFCPMVILPYDETIQIEGGFEAGTINLQINDFSTTIDL